MKKFAMVGSAGFVAPRHMKAILETGNQLVAALDPRDCMGVVDSYFPDTHFFTEFERFDRHLDKLRRAGQGIDYLSICSPNYLHDSHIRFALRSGADAICEKPLVLNPWNLDALSELEAQTGRRVNTILQLRLHPSIIALKQRLDRERAEQPGRVHDIDLSYVTARGRWYPVSWKGDAAKSGGIASNIGIHFFDMLIWLFGPPQASVVHQLDQSRGAGFLQLGSARVRWFLSVDYQDVPRESKEKGQRTFRSITVDGQELEFSEGFADLHTLSYQGILAGQGFGLEQARPSIEAVFAIRNSQPVGREGDYHPLLR